MGTATDAEETGGLFEGFVAETRNLFQLLARGKRPIFIAPGDDILGERGIEAGDVGEELLGGGVELDADGVLFYFSK